MPQNTYFSRQIQDSTFSSTKAFPAAAANNNHSAFDLGQRTAVSGGLDAGFQTEDCELLISAPATPNLADAKTIIFSIYDSADGSTYAVMPGFAAVLTLTGASGAGAAAASVRVRLPSTTRRYIRVNQAVLTAGGDSTALSSTVQLLF
jgi:hypothetical protein